MTENNKNEGTPCLFFKRSKWCEQPEELDQPDRSLCTDCIFNDERKPAESLHNPEPILVLEDDSNKQDIIIALTNCFMDKHRFMTVNGDIYKYEDGIYLPNGTMFIEKMSEWLLGDRITSNMVNEVVLHVKRRTYTDVDNMPLYKYLPLSNGLLNFDTMTLVPFNPDLFFTFKLPVKYDPSADCPKFKSIINDIMDGDEKKISLLQEIFGYCLCPGMPAQKSFWFYGTGANGKSTVANILTSLLGRNNVSSLDLHEIEYQRFALASLDGKLANILGEPSPKDLEKSSNFKKLTGGDIVSADRKNRDRIEFVNRAKMIIYANQYPMVSDASEAFWRRVLVLGFTHKFDEAEATKEVWHEVIDDENEMAGVLIWSLEGLNRLKNNNFVFTLSDSDVKREFMLNANPTTIFVDECCIMDSDEWTSNDDLWVGYSDWCCRAGVSPEDKNVFMKYISNLPGVINKRKTINGLRYYGKQGIGLKPSDDYDNGNNPNEPDDGSDDEHDDQPDRSYDNVMLDRFDIDNIGNICNDKTKHSSCNVNNDIISIDNNDIIFTDNNDPKHIEDSLQPSIYDDNLKVSKVSNLSMHPYLLDNRVYRLYILNRLYIGHKRECMGAQPDQTPQPSTTNITKTLTPDENSSSSCSRSPASIVKPVLDLSNEDVQRVYHYFIKSPNDPVNESEIKCYLDALSPGRNVGISVVLYCLDTLLYHGLIIKVGPTLYKLNNSYKNDN